MKKEDKLKYSLSESEINDIKTKEQIDLYIRNELYKKELEIIKEKNEDLNVNYHLLKNSEKKKDELKQNYRESKGRVMASIILIIYGLILFLMPMFAHMDKIIANITQIFGFFSGLFGMYMLSKNLEIKNMIKENLDKLKF